jgi:hypothetical protein
MTHNKCFRIFYLEALMLNKCVNIVNKCVKIFDLDAPINKNRVNGARKGAGIMASRMDWVPAQEEKLAGLMDIWLKKLPVTALQTAYGWPAKECTAATAAFTAFFAARTAYQAAPTKANHTEKEEQKKAAVGALRKFARERIRNNSAMTDAQKQELGITVADPEPSPVPVPDAGPDSEAVINAREPGVVKVRYLGAKPYGVERVEIAFSLSETAIDSPDQLTTHEPLSRNPGAISFSGQLGSHDKVPNRCAPYPAFFLRL